MFSRSYIFTENERRRLKAWLESDVEDNQTKKLFTGVRRGLTPIKRDMELKIAARLMAHTSDFRAPTHKLSGRI